MTVLQKTENSVAGGEFKVSILASAVCYETFTAGFQICDSFFFIFFFLQFPKSTAQIYLSLTISSRKKSVHPGRPQLNNSSFQGPVFDKPQVILF